jgi:mono/diheme cytochrome c family protein
VPLPRSRRVVCAALLLATQAEAARARAAAPRTTRDRIYTAAQAERGKQAYMRACVQCHALEFYRGDIMKAWEGGSLHDFYESIATTMPLSNPGSLKRREYLDMVAYILSLNRMPTGEEDLPARPDDLKGIRIRWRNKP